MQILNRNVIRLAMLTLFISTNCFTKAQKASNTIGFKYKKGYYFLTNEKGKINKEVEPFSYAVPFSEGLALVEKDLKFGYIDSIGNLVIDYQFDDAGSYKDGITYASINGKYGYINKQGTFVIEPQYDHVYQFNGEYAEVHRFIAEKNEAGVRMWEAAMIDSKGNLLAGQYFSSINFNIQTNCFEATSNDSIFRVSLEGEVSFESLKGDSVFEEIEEMPMYPGGAYGLRKHIASNVRYPISAQKNGLQGKFYIQFVVNTTGEVVDVKSVTSECPLLEMESRRVIEMMLPWLPGKREGKPVKVSFTVPVNFVLQ